MTNNLSPTLLALDTATEQCSVAVRLRGQLFTRLESTARGHADMVLPMIEAVMAEANLSFADLDAIAVGRGPGAFTGVRLGIGVTQGLAMARQLPVLPVSDLAAVAQQAAVELGVGEQVLVCMDARMGEVYAGVFVMTAAGVVQAVSDERVCAPEAVAAWVMSLQLANPPKMKLGVSPKLGIGAGFAAYESLRFSLPNLAWRNALPRATEIATLAEQAWHAGRAIAVMELKPVYLRDQVTHQRQTATTPATKSS